MDSQKVAVPVCIVALEDHVIKTGPPMPQGAQETPALLPLPGIRHSETATT